MRHAIIALFTLVATLPASAHGLHAAPVDGHAHGPLIAALVVLPVIALLVFAIVRGFRR